MSRILVSPAVRLARRAEAIQNSSAKVSATWTNTGSRIIWTVMPLLRHAHELLAEIFPLQQSDEGLRRVLEALGHVLAVLDPAFLDPLRHVANELGKLGGEVRHDE